MGASDKKKLPTSGIKFLKSKFGHVRQLNTLTQKSIFRQRKLNMWRLTWKNSATAEREVRDSVYEGGSIE
jgi:hypothetical protein